jgi:dipeptide/tripeptide permease
VDRGKGAAKKMTYTLADLLGLIFAAWFFTYLIEQSLGGIISLFRRLDWWRFQKKK